MKLFLPFLTDDQGKSLKEENAVVVTRSIPDPIDNSPEGWENNTVQFSRNNEFRGIIKAYTTSLKFFFEGAKILRDTFYRKGMEAVLYFIWLKQNTAFGAGMKYEGWYKGEPDFGTFKDEYDGVSVAITEGGFYKDLQANKSIVQEIPFDSDAVSIEMDGMDIQQNIKYIVTNGAVLSNNGQHSLDLPLVSQEITAQINAESQERKYFTDNANLLTLVIPFLVTGSVTQDVQIKAKFGFSVTLESGLTPNPAAGVQLLVRAFTDAGVATGYVLANFGGSSNLYNRHHNVDIDTTISVPENRKLFFLMFLTIGGVIASGPSADQAVYWQYDNAEGDFVSIFTLYRFRRSIVPAYRVFTLGDKIVKKINSNVSLSGAILENDFNLLATSGDAIRGLPNVVIKTSFSDWHKSIDAVKCIILDIVNNNPVIRSRYDGYNKNLTIANLGECSNWTLEPADDYIYDTVEVGYPSKSANNVNDINGKSSFNNTFTWKINVTRRVKNTYDAKSIYFADPFDIELIRINLGDKATTAGTNDNSVFFIDGEKIHENYTGNIAITSIPSVIIFDAIGYNLQNGTKFKIDVGPNSSTVFTVIYAYEFSGQTIMEVVEPVVAESITGTIEFLHYRLRRVAYTTIIGVLNNTVFNVELSPRRILQNHLRWLRSSFDHLDANKLTDPVTEKNKDLVTIDSLGNVISEKADILVSSMGEKVYLPYYVSFDITSPENLITLMQNVSGKFDYTMNGISLDGFTINIKSQDATQETQNYQLLCTANVDTLKLINNR